MKKAVLAIAALLASFAADAATPPPLEDPFLENLTGKWKVERKIRGTLVANTKDVANPPKYEALVMIGWDGSQERYVAHWMDVYGGRLSAMGYGKRDGNAIGFRFDYPDGPFYNTFHWEPGERGWTMVLENTDKDGMRVPFAEDRVRRH